MKNHITKALLFALALNGSGCFLFQQDDDSESLGSVHVEALLDADTCGPGIVTGGATMSYDVDLGKQGDVLLWESSQGSARGTFSSASQFCIEVSNTWQARAPDEWLGDPGCTMRQVERLCGTLELAEETGDDGEPVTRVTGLSGRHEAFVSGVTGSNCNDQLGLSTGQYLMLPCQVAYSLTGEAIDD